MFEIIRINGSIFLQTLPFAQQSTSGKQKSGSSKLTESQPKKKPRIVPSKDPGFAFEIEGLDGTDDRMEHVTKFGNKSPGTIILLIFKFLRQKRLCWNYWQ